MNPLTNMKNVTKLSESELLRGGKSSWHDQYKHSAWIFVGGLPYDLSEGDVLCVFSQYGEIVNINLVRDKLSGKQKGFCFICYENQLSTVLAVDNLNGIKILGKSLRVDHCENYKPPKDNEKMDEETRLLHTEGCAPKPQLSAEQIKQENLKQEMMDDVRLPPRLPIALPKTEPIEKVKKEKKKKDRKKSKKEKKSKRSKRSTSSSSDSSSSSRHRKRKSRP